MADKKPTILKFVLKSSGNPMAVMDRFHPQGQTVLNRTEWHGKEPRSCAVTKISGRTRKVNSPEPTIWDIEVSYRPKGHITFVGGTKYDGWTCMMLDKKADGTLLDGKGNPLPEGAKPIYLPFEAYNDVEFHNIEFGEFIEEKEVKGIDHLSFDEVMTQIQASSRVNATIHGTFMAPRKQRPLVKIILSNAPSGVSRDGFGTRIVNVNNLTPHLKQVVLDHFTDVVSGFIEGRYSMNQMSTDDFVFVGLNEVLVDCTPNEKGEDSRFNILNEYVPEQAVEELVIRLMATYEVDINIVDGPKGGLLMRQLPQPR